MASVSRKAGGEESRVNRKCASSPAPRKGRGRRIDTQTGETTRDEELQDRQSCHLPAPRGSLGCSYHLLARRRSLEYSYSLLARRRSLEYSYHLQARRRSLKYSYHFQARRCSLEYSYHFQARRRPSEYSYHLSRNGISGPAK
ncbi:hypothetical protein BDY21DRAFT_367332 [Lineolata rhizophorae]|uniref:Uncharacterized protein n=1 Tax=Lineolata rhizophorae TaxID=578093 RepID=A0A6A6NMY4_9PEZI|nr:hypothetical protein BDY21DRAFT_367332 [Lineolata rhizophorae]